MRKHAQGLRGIIWSEPENKLKPDVIPSAGLWGGRAHERWLEDLCYRPRFLHYGKVLVVRLHAPDALPDAVQSVRLPQNNMGITRNLRAQDQQTDDQNGQFHLLLTSSQKLLSTNNT
jgi:hypothetical protein